MPSICVLSQSVVLLAAASLSFASECVVHPGSTLRIVLPPGTKRPSKPGAVLSGSLARPVYSGTCQAIPQGVQVRAVVGQVEHRGIGRISFGVLKRLAGASEKPKSLTLQSVEIDAPGLASIPLTLRFLRMEKLKSLTASAKPPKAERNHVLLLQVEQPLSVPATAEAVHSASSGTMPPGTSVLVDLVTPLDSARSRNGDVVQVRVAQPVFVGGHAIVPEGTIFEGVVAHAKRARRPYRAGRMRLNIHSLRLPGAQPVEIAVSTTAGEFTNETKLDAEGGFHGGGLNRKQALLNVAVAYVTGKLLDDMIEGGAKAALGAAVAGSAETAARYVGLGVGTALFLMHRGREVSLDSHTQLQLTVLRETHIQP